MGDHEAFEDEDVIVVMTDENGKEFYYREEMMIPVGDERFAILIPLSVSSEDELVETEEEDEATIAKIIADESGEDIYTEPTDDEFKEVRRAYELLEGD